MSLKIITKDNAAMRIYGDAHELALKAARGFARIADQYVVGCGKFSVALSGGSTPKEMFSILSREPFLDTIPWSSIYFFWGDERCVPPDHPDSNFRMADDTLLSKVPVPREHIFRIPAEDRDPHRAAADYSATIRDFFGGAQLPRFDMIFLGMGADGHTASLFPGSDALNVADKIAVANYVEKFQSYRITLTAPSINNARNITFLVAGEDKATVLKQVIDGPYLPEKYPSQLIKPVDGSLLWMVDEKAGEQYRER